jgi:hypothetical protein
LKKNSALNAIVQKQKLNFKLFIVAVAELYCTNIKFKEGEYMTKKHKDGINPELSRQLNERKSRLSRFKLWHKNPHNPTPEKSISEHQQFLRDIALKIHNEDYPPQPPFGEPIEDFWNTGLDNKEPEPHKQPENTFDPALNSLVEQSNEHNQAENEVERISKLPKDKLQKWLDEPETE